VDGVKNHWHISVMAYYFIDLNGQSCKNCKCRVTDSLIIDQLLGGGSKNLAYLTEFSRTT
jgi:hypothetical protein